MGRFLGIDVGSKTLGLAISDDAGSIALPVTVIRRTGRLGRDLDELEQWLEGRDVTDVVVGLPLNLDGTPGQMAEEAKGVGNAIAKRFGLAVHRWDERMTTVSAERVLLEADVSRRKRKQVIDQIAATLILQAFLDHRARAGAAPAPDEVPR